jgi:chromosome segregation ATPase
LRSARDEAARIEEASARATDELRQALQQAQDKGEKLASELAVARQEVEAKTAVARAAGDEVRRAVETSKQSAEEQGQALREAQGNAEKLATELTAARKEIAARPRRANKGPKSTARPYARHKARPRSLQQIGDSSAGGPIPGIRDEFGEG